jgi:hypothetical protein
MENFIARANIDHYVELLVEHDMQPSERHVIRQLLIEEEGKLSYDPEQLEFLERKILVCRARLSHLRRACDRGDPNTSDRADVELALANLETTLALLEHFRGEMRSRIWTSQA